MTDSDQSDDSNSTDRRSRGIRYCRPDDGPHPLSDVDERVQTATLQAQVEKLQQERERLESEQQVELLEGERGDLRETIEYKDQQRQQLIENYERRLAEKNRQLRVEQSEAEDSGTVAPVSAIRKPAATAAETVRDGGRLVRNSLAILRSVPSKL